MKLIGCVRGLSQFRDNIHWHVPNLYHCYNGKIEETIIEVNDISPILAEFLSEKSLLTNESIPEKEKVKYKIINLADLKIKYCDEDTELFDEKLECVPYVRYRAYDQLKYLVTQTDMIAQLGHLQEAEVYLKFYFR